MRIAVIGTGYVGLVSAVCLADKGHRVICVDIDAAKVARINRAESPIYEKGLPELLARHVGGNLTATTDLADAVNQSEITFIAVGTPVDGGQLDLRQLRQAVSEVGAALQYHDDYHVVVVKSTVTPGVTDDVVTPLLQLESCKSMGEQIGVAVNPEFLSEGVAVEDFMRPDRIVVGGCDERAGDKLASVYHGFDAPLVRVNNKTAEMIKYASNALQATAISFANELAGICAQSEGVDATDVMEGVHQMRELAGAGLTRFLRPGCGFGGSCFPKDMAALLAHAQQVQAPAPIIQSALALNAQQPARMLRMLATRFPDPSGLKVAVLGLAFKPNTDDVRESPALPVIQSLLQAGVQVRAYDPIANDNARQFFGGNIEYADDLQSAIAGRDAILLVTAWDEFAGLPELIRRQSHRPLLIDGRRMIDKNDVDDYMGIGLHFGQQLSAAGSCCGGGCGCGAGGCGCSGGGCCNGQCDCGAVDGRCACGKVGCC